MSFSNSHSQNGELACAKLAAVVVVVDDEADLWMEFIVVYGEEIDDYIVCIKDFLLVYFFIFATTKKQ
jgi:hypothetical protein